MPEGGLAPSRPGVGVRVLERPRVFVDFEASALDANSFPVEVAWSILGEDLSIRTESHILRPKPQWRRRKWCPNAERVHGLSLDRLEREGEDAEDVWLAFALDTGASLPGAEVAVSHVPSDRKWMGDFAASAGETPPETIDVLEVLLASGVGGDFLAALPFDPEAEFGMAHRAGPDAAMLAVTARRCFRFANGKAD